MHLLLIRHEKHIESSEKWVRQCVKDAYFLRRTSHPAASDIIERFYNETLLRWETLRREREFLRSIAPWLDLSPMPEFPRAAR